MTVGFRNDTLPYLVGLIILAVAGSLLGSCSGKKADPNIPAEQTRCDVTAFVPEVPTGRGTEVMVPMRDCVKLATDVYLPRDPGPYPTLLVRLPYHKFYGGLEPVPVMGLYGLIFSANGYAVVIQDSRGRYASEGVFVPFEAAQADGMDTVRWIEAQPWFNGNLGTFGGSYHGFTQLAVAHQRPACLKALVPLVTPSSIYSLLYHSGLPRADTFIQWALNLVEEDAMEGEAFQKAALHRPFMEADDVSVGDVPWFDEWLAHPFNDSFYDTFLPRNVMESIDLPMLMISGWFDVFAQSQLRDFETVQARESSPGNTRIIIGPWTHTMGFGEDHDMYFANSESILNYIGYILDWYNHFLKGKPFFHNWGPVRIYNPGTGRWTDRSTLWSPQREAHSLYLSGGQGATSCQPTGALLETPDSQPSLITYTYNPLDPLINWGGNLLEMENGCDREEAHCDRSDAVTFESARFEREITLDGEIFLELRVSSTAPDTAFVGRLALIEENGKAYVLRQGVITLSHRNGNSESSPYTPREIVDIRIEMPPLLWTVNAGEALRLEISSSSFPSVVQHPNVAKDWFSVTDPKPAEQSLYLQPEAPARLVFMKDTNFSGSPQRYLPRSEPSREPICP